MTEHTGHVLTHEDQINGITKRWAGHISNKVWLNCLVCGKRFWLWPSDMVNGRGKYCSPKCRNHGRSTMRRHLKNNGYWHVRVADGKGGVKLIAEHRYIIEKEIGRPLERREHVHHIDSDRTNNELRNLYLCRCDRHHRKIHKMGGAQILSMLATARYMFYPKLEHLDPTRNLQEDIQEMLKQHHDCINENVRILFHDFDVTIPRDWQVWTDSELWIACYMDSVHNLTWTEKGWQ